MTGIATAIYENEATRRRRGRADARIARTSAAQLAGVEQLEGTYPFTLARSVKGYRLNKFLHGLVEPAHRARSSSPTRRRCSTRRGLTDEERDLVRRRDWRGADPLRRRSSSCWRSSARWSASSNLHIYAAMRGQTLEDFQKTRNAPGALYSVAGKDAEELRVGQGAAGQGRARQGEGRRLRQHAAGYRPIFRSLHYVTVPRTDNMFPGEEPACVCLCLFPVAVISRKDA